MGTKLFHQCGHCSNWNIATFEDEECGDGLVLSPVHQKRNEVERLDKKTKSRSIFDPQFYLPNSQKAKLNTYSFFPEAITPDSFSTEDFGLVAFQAARECIEFQVANNFSRLIIPARYFDQMYTNFTDRQDSYTVHPFLKALSHTKSKKPVYLTIPLTSHMVIDKNFRTRILNWATSFPEITGVYVMTAPHDQSAKQVQSDEFLFAYMEFLLQLRRADLEVLVGYCNTEGLLYLLVDGCDITFGTFENTRMFSIDKFLLSDEERRGPRPRIFSAGLLNWIQLGYAKEIMEEDKVLWEKIYDRTDYGDRVLKLPGEPNFNQPMLYKHHFLAFSSVVDELRALPVIERYKNIRNRLRKAEELYKEIENLPMDLEVHSRGTHVQPWLKAVNKFYRTYLCS